MTFLDFIEIGTSDFDTEIQKQDKKIGISIDAVKYYIDRLPLKKNCKKINIAISDFIGNIKVYYLSENVIQKYNLPSWTRGCNSVNKYHPTIEKILKDKKIDIQKIISVDNVLCTTLLDFLAESHVTGMFFLKIDTEGHDLVILNHFLNNCKDNSKLPHKIQFESNILTSRIDVQNTIDLAIKTGYKLQYSNGDTMLKLSLHNLHSKTGFMKLVSYTISSIRYTTKTIDDAQVFCKNNNCTGIVEDDNNFNVADGEFLETSSDKNSCWIFI